MAAFLKSYAAKISANMLQEVKVRKANGLKDKGLYLPR